MKGKHQHNKSIKVSLHGNHQKFTFQEFLEKA